MGQENPTPEKYELWDKSRGKPEKNKAFKKKKKLRQFLRIILLKFQD